MICKASIAIVLIAAIVPDTFAAGDVVLERYESPQSFVGPNDENLHPIFYAPIFTGHWLAVPIYCKPEEPDVAQKAFILGLVFVDVSGRRPPLQFRFPKGVRPSRFTGRKFVVLSPERLAVMILNPRGADRKPDLFRWDVNLEDASVTRRETTGAVQEEFIRVLESTPEVFADSEVIGALESSVSPKTDLPLSGSGESPLRYVTLAAEDHDRRFVGPGSAPERRIVLDVFSNASFDLREVDLSSPAQPYARYSPADLTAVANFTNRRIVDLQLPALLLPPVTALFLVATADDHSEALIRIAHSRKHKLWEAPRGFTVRSLYQSENDEYVAMQLHNRDRALDTKLVLASLKMPHPVVIDEPIEDGGDFYYLSGVTNQGELLLQCERTSGFYSASPLPTGGLHMKELLAAELEPGMGPCLH